MQDNSWQERLRNYEHDPGDGMWDRIHPALPTGSAPGALAGRMAGLEHRPSPAAWKAITARIRPGYAIGRRVVAAMLTVAATVSILLFFNVLNNHSSQNTLSTENEAQPKNEAETAPGTSVEIASFEESVEVNNRDEAAFSGSNQNSDAIKGIVEPVIVAQATDMESTEPASALFAFTENKTTGLIQSAESGYTKRAATLPPAQIISDNEARRPAGRQEPYPSVALLPPVSELLSANWLVGAGNYSALGSSGSSMQENGDLANDGLSFNNSLAQNSAKQYTDISYSTPLYLGVNAEYLAGRRFSFGTGLGFLQMGSEQTLTVQGTGQTGLTNNTMHRYLALPLYAKWRFLQGRKTALYALLGSSVETFIGGTYTATDEQTGQSVTGNIAEGSTQANINAGLGVQYQFGRQWGLFAEVNGAHYYLLPEPNFWSQRQIWPGMKFGILFSW